MKTFGGISFSGQSGNRYHFAAWPLDTRFKALAAVYFVTRRVHQNTTYDRASHEGIYIGETEDLSMPLSGHARRDCFGELGANCVCICLMPDAARRRTSAQDLIDRHAPPCNRD